MTDTKFPVLPQNQGDRRSLLTRFWETLTNPPESIRQPELRRRMRLLSGLLLLLVAITIPSILSTLLVDPEYKPFSDPIFYLALISAVIFAGCYWLNRAGRYRLSAGLSLTTLSLVVLSAVAITDLMGRTGADGLVNYMLFPVVLSSVLLPVLGTVLLVIGNVIVLALMPNFLSGLSYEVLVYPISFVLVVSAAILVVAVMRQRDLQQIERQADALALAVREAEEANRLKDQFLASMSHELRTPLNAIIGFSEVMQMGLAGELNDKAKHATERIYHNSERLLALINDILDISKIEAGRMEVVLQPFEPANLLASIDDTLKRQAGAKGLAFETSLDPALPDRLVGDFKRLEQILFNLVSNAVKFTEKGSVSVALKRAGDRWLMVVTDTGIGIPPHAHELIFEKFRQVDGSSRRAYGGTGLGLAIVRELAIMMDGQVQIESQPNIGSTFAVSFPIILERESI
nr:hypothetical protein [Anaerolineae bacterium]